MNRLLILLFSGTMEEKIYNRQVKKESLAGHMIDEQLFERCISKKDTMLYDFMDLNQDVEEKSKTRLSPEEDKLLAEVLNEEGDKIWSVHKHDDLLQHQMNETLSEEEVRHAWEIFQQEEELRRVLPKRVLNEMVNNLLAKPTKESSTKNLASKKYIHGNKDIDHNDKVKIKTRSSVRDDGTYWQKDNKWTGIIKWDETMETECQVSTYRDAKDDEHEEESVDLKETVYVGYIDRCRLKRIPRSVSFKTHVFDVLNNDTAHMDLIQEKLKDSVAVDVDDELCILLMTKQEESKTFLIGMTTRDSMFCQQISQALFNFPAGPQVPGSMKDMDLNMRDVELLIQENIDAHIKEIIETVKDQIQAKANVLIYQNKCLSKMAKVGKAKIVENLMKVEFIDINTRNNEGQTPLILACRKGHFEIVSKLLGSQKTDVDAVDIHGFTALLHAATTKDVTAVRLLLERGVRDINHKNHMECTALVLASQKGFHEVVKELLAQDDIDVNTEDADGDAPLIYASEEGHQKVVDLLLAHPDINVNKSNKNGDVSLMCAANRGHAPIIEKLLESKAIIANFKNNDGYTALMCAADKGNTKVMELLLGHKNIDVNIADTNNDTALNWAVDKEHEEIVRKIIGHGHVEKTQRNLKAIKAHLLQNKAIFGSPSRGSIFNNPLIAAIEGEEVEIVKWLLEHNDVQINRYEQCAC